MKLLAAVVILGALAGLWVINRKRQLFNQHVPFGEEFDQRWERLPKVETGVRRRF